MQNSGNKLVILMCTLAAVAAVVGWWSRYAATHRAAEFWGPDGATLLRGPSQVELLRLGDVEQGSETASSSNAMITLAEQPIVARYDTSQAKGLTHLRSALVEDRNFDWDQPLPVTPRGCNPWAWGLRFHSGTASLTVLFSRDFAKVAKWNAGDETMSPIPCPALAQPLATYFRSLEAQNL